MLTKLQSKFEAQMAKKRAIEDNAARTRSRMEQVDSCLMATALALVFFGGDFSGAGVRVGTVQKIERIFHLETHLGRFISWRLRGRRRNHSQLCQNQVVGISVDSGPPTVRLKRERIL